MVFLSFIFLPAPAGVPFVRVYGLGRPLQRWPNDAILQLFRHPELGAAGTGIVLQLLFSRHDGLAEGEIHLLLKAAGAELTADVLEAGVSIGVADF